MMKLQNESPKGQRSLTRVQHAQKVKYGLSAIMAGNSEVNCPLWPHFEHLRDFMPA